MASRLAPTRPHNPASQGERFNDNRTTAIDTAHSSVDFVARHMMVSKIRGTFADWRGAIDVDLEDPALSSVTVTTTVASLETRDKKRDGHLLSADFFGTSRRQQKHF